MVWSQWCWCHRRTMVDSVWIWQWVGTAVSIDMLYINAALSEESFNCFDIITGGVREGLLVTGKWTMKLTYLNISKGQKAKNVEIGWSIYVFIYFVDLWYAESLCWCVLYTYSTVVEYDMYVVGGIVSYHMEKGSSRKRLELRVWQMWFRRRQRLREGKVR